MMKRTFILACIATTSLCYGMEEEPLSIKKISAPEDIKKGLALVYGTSLRGCTKNP